MLNEDLARWAGRCNLVYLYSGEHFMYWRESGHGYATRAAEAGEFEREEAEKRIRGCGPEKQLELRPVPAPDYEHSRDLIARDLLVRLSEEQWFKLTGRITQQFDQSPHVRPYSRLFLTLPPADLAAAIWEVVRA